MKFNKADVSLRGESRLTERSQTTIPAAIRDALHLKPGDVIEYLLLAGGKVVISRHEERAEHEDPVVTQFLSFLEKDMLENPHRIQVLNAELWEKAKELTAGIEVDLDAPLTDDE